MNVSWPPPGMSKDFLGATISRDELIVLLTRFHVKSPGLIAEAFLGKPADPVDFDKFLVWINDGKGFGSLKPPDSDGFDREVLNASPAFSETDGPTDTEQPDSPKPIGGRPKLIKRKSGLSMSTEAFVEGSLQDDPQKRSASKAKPMTDTPFGTHKFRGAEAAPWLKKVGLSPKALDDPSWTSKHAETVAQAVTSWATARGATMVCHWSQPLRSATWRGSAPTRMVHAIFNPGADGKPVSILDGSYLLSGEGDSRKMIDITSAMWVQQDILFIPSVLVNYNNSTFSGMDPVLCEKTPLLRAMHAVSLAGVRLLRLLGHRCATVVPKIGLEQEFFLVPRGAYDRRWDLQRCGRTLLGALPDGTDLYDTHSTPLNEVAQACMREIQSECFKLGIHLRTRHRESAPNQYEYAPHFGLASSQIDENLLIMELIEDVAKKHGLAALLHEKPFTGVNGSGKHNNFSLGTDTGLNLFNEKHANSITSDILAPHEAFPVIMAAVCRAVYRHGNLMMTSVACPGNDFRLNKTGGCEAPPTCVSIHLGESLTEYMTQFANSPEPMSDPFSVQKNKVLLGIPAIDLHGIEVSTEPRNRTSPFPYAGRRFELRSPGASQNMSMVNVVLCTILAESFNLFSDAIEGGAAPRDIAKKALKEEGGLKAIYNDNNYVEKWRTEAESRGLVSVDSVVDGVCQLTQDRSIALFESLKVLSRTELEERVDVMLENYVITVDVEARCMIDMVKRQIIPAAHKANIWNAGTKESPELLEQLIKDIGAMQEEVNELHEIDEFEDQARKAREIRLTTMTSIRSLCNEVEKFVPATDWPIASYHDLLFDDMHHCKCK